ncbi:MAG: hypothetical protein KatS3mg085_598 [Candidatus Dojkabacteria bacterium]|nr:MAG: hypothetical protein KatS3mg085_598 [Candidatus Dojkabacteria bacterium]
MKKFRYCLTKNHNICKEKPINGSRIQSKIDIIWQYLSSSLEFSSNISITIDLYSNISLEVNLMLKDNIYIIGFILFNNKVKVKKAKTEFINHEFTLENFTNFILSSIENLL